MGYKNKFLLQIIKLILQLQLLLIQGLHPPTNGVDGDNDGFRGQLGPGHMDAQLMDVSIDKGEWQTQLLFQHLKPKVQVVEHCIAPP